MIHGWLQAHLSGPEAKTILELGAHVGTDTAFLAALPGATVHAFEPDPRNLETFQAHLPNVVLVAAAVGAVRSRAPFYPSLRRGDREWSLSGSLYRPTGHLVEYPDVTFGEPFDVEVVTLDKYCDAAGIGRVDFVWADVQGGEAKVVAGGTRTFRRTRYLYTEYCDIPLYEGQQSLAALRALLPDWRLLASWPSGECYADALLENPNPEDAR